MVRCKINNDLATALSGPGDLTLADDGVHEVFELILMNSLNAPSDSPEEISSFANMATPIR